MKKRELLNVTAAVVNSCHCLPADVACCPPSSFNLESGCLASHLKSALERLMSSDKA